MIEHLTEETFKEKIFDYTTEKEFKYKGTTPALIDFYADWCGPCKMVAPILEELAKEYEGKIDIYKINTEKEETLAGMFGIRSIPSLLFLPVGKDPQMGQGAMTKAQFEKAFKDIFGIDAPEEKKE
ncbi:MAG: thioredoxin [Bacteroidales bacterium]